MTSWPCRSLNCPNARPGLTSNSSSPSSTETNTTRTHYREGDPFWITGTVREATCSSNLLIGYTVKLYLVHVKHLSGIR